MEKVRIKQQSQIVKGTKHVVTLTLLLLTSLLPSSCSVITGIFKAGMGFGIFIVVAIVILVIILFLRLGKNKND